MLDYLVSSTQLPRLVTKRTEKKRLEKRHITLFSHRHTPCRLDDGCYSRR